MARDRTAIWVQQATWPWVLLGLCSVTMLFTRARHFAPTERAMLWPDALGLGPFAASGTQIALGASMPTIVAVLMGVTTAVVGGVLRDIVCNEIPRAFKDWQPYVVCAFAGGWVPVGAQAAGLHGDWSLVADAATATGALALALALALRFGYRLPRWSAGTAASKARPRHRLRPGTGRGPAGRARAASSTPRSAVRDAACASTGRP